LIEIIGLLLIFFVWIIHGSRALVLNFILFWWLFWLAISKYSFAGVYVPSNETYFVFYFFLFSIFIGSLISLALPIKNKILFDDDMESLKVSKLERIFLGKVFYIVISVVFMYFSKSIYLFITIDSLELYRGAVFGLGHAEGSILFGSGHLLLLYILTIKSLIMAMFFIGLSIYVNSGKLRLMLWASLFLMMDGVMMLGRFQVYYIIAFLPIAFILRNGFIALFSFRNFLFLSFAIALVLMLSFMRGTVDFIDFVNIFIVNYHTYSFNLFGQALNDSESFLNTDTTFGLASIGSVVTIFTLILRRFGFDIEPISSHVGSILNESVQVGSDALGGGIFANAFYSILYSLYLDGGLIAIWLFGMAYGLLLIRVSYSRQLKNRVVLFFLIYIGFFGLFQPVLIQNILWWFFIFVISYYFVIRRTKVNSG
jgi:oligosaccharide repeat unit polymerase